MLAALRFLRAPGTPGHDTARREAAPRKNPIGAVTNRRRRASKEERLDERREEMRRSPFTAAARPPWISHPRPRGSGWGASPPAVGGGARARVPREGGPRSPAVGGGKTIDSTHESNSAPSLLRSTCRAGRQSVARSSPWRTVRYACRRYSFARIPSPLRRGSPRNARPRRRPSVSSYRYKVATVTRRRPTSWFSRARGCVRVRDRAPVAARCAQAEEDEEDRPGSKRDRKRGSPRRRIGLKALKTWTG